MVLKECEKNFDVGGGEGGGLGMCYPLFLVVDGWMGRWGW